MHKTFILILLMTMLPAIPVMADDDVLGDIDGDGALTASDVEYLADYVLGIDTLDMAGGYEFVDLGLPSGLCWATANVGASKPSESGGYYAWGETEEKESYDWANYRWGDSDSTLTRYCRSTVYGSVPDNISTLLPCDDVARLRMGGHWRMPTFSEIYDLYNRCSWQLTTQDDVKGYTITGTNGNSIFLPLTGYCDGTDLVNYGSDGFYWSTDLYYTRDDVAYGLLSLTYDYWWGTRSRYTGRTVRACMTAPTKIYDVNGDGRISVADIPVLVSLVMSDSGTQPLKPEQDWDVWE